MLSAAGSLRWLRDVVGGDVRRAGRRGGALAGRHGGARRSCPTSRASGRRTPTRPRGPCSRDCPCRHDRGALVRSVLEGVAYGLRDSLELLRALGVEPGVGPRVRRRRPQRALAEDRRLRARDPDRAHGGRGGRRLRRGAPRRRRRAASSPPRRRRSTRASASATRSSPTPSGSASTTTATARFTALYPAIKGVSNELRRQERRSSPARAAASAPRSRGCSTTAGASVGLASRQRRRPRPRARARSSPATSATRKRWTPSVAATVERFGGLDIVVANAGVGAYGPFLELSREHLEEMIDVNLKGTLYAMRAALPHLLKSDAADVVTLASEAGRRGPARTRPSTARRSSARSASRARSTTSCASRASAARTSARAASPPTSRSRTGRGRTPDVLPGMMTAEDVAEIVMFVLTRPRTHRILETAIRPMTETSAGADQRRVPVISRYSRGWTIVPRASRSSSRRTRRTSRGTPHAARRRGSRRASSSDRSSRENSCQ